MFRRFKKGLAAGTIFTVVSNMHACTYGPPPESMAPSSDIKVYDTSQNDSSEVNDDTTTTSETTTTTTTTTTTKASDPSFDPDDNLNVDVYGPPEDFEPKETEATQPNDDYDPDINLNECVYGPPEWFDDSSKDDVTTTTTKKATTTTAETKRKKKTTTVTTAKKATTTTTAQVTKEFDVDENMNVCVYGPPEWFDDSSGGK